jgi:hypothetical protein
VELIVAVAAAAFLLVFFAVLWEHWEGWWRIGLVVIAGGFLGGSAYEAMASSYQRGACEAVRYVEDRVGFDDAESLFADAKPDGTDLLLYGDVYTPTDLQCDSGIIDAEDTRW